MDCTMFHSNKKHIFNKELLLQMVHTHNYWSKTISFLFCEESSTAYLLYVLYLSMKTYNRKFNIPRRYLSSKPINYVAKTVDGHSLI
jgi:hypothetical protein